MSRVRVAVVGAGAWGLPAAAELARRGHEVTLVDMVGPANPLASSSGATRIWRLAHPDRVRVRLAQRAVEAWERVESRSETRCRTTTGLLWRLDGWATVAASLAAEGVEHRVIGADDVGLVYPGLSPDGQGAVWQPEAGAVLADVALRAFAAGFEAAGGAWSVGRRVVGLGADGDGVRVDLEGGQPLRVDRVVVAAGPWAGRLLRSVGVEVPLRPVVQQVSYVGGAAGESLPCLVDGGEPGDVLLYALPTPGRGLKVGLEVPLRELDPDADDRDRSPSADLEALASRRVSRILPGLDPAVTGSEVCTWTFGPDGRFVIDSAVDGRVVFACGDSGEGFKFAPLVGEALADLAEGRGVGPDLAEFSMRRFAGAPPTPPSRMDVGH